MLKTERNTLIHIGDTVVSSIPPNQNEIIDLQQKSLVAIKAEWSSDYIHWTAILAAITKLSESPAIKNRNQDSSLKKQAWDLRSLMDKKFKNIEVEIDDFLRAVYRSDAENEGYEYSGRFWDLQSDIAFFRKKARNIELSFLQNILNQIPQNIY